MPEAKKENPLDPRPWVGECVQEIVLDPQEFANFIMIGRAGKRVTVESAFQKYMEKEGRRPLHTGFSCFVLKLLSATVGPQRVMSNTDLSDRIRRLRKVG